MPTFDVASLRELADLVQQAVEDDYPAPASWTRPSWWRDEFDQFVPMARYVIYSASQGASQLRKHRSPEALKADRDRMKRKEAPAKVAHYRERIPHYESRIAELEHALKHDLRLAKREDGSPYDWDVQAEDDLHRARANLQRAWKSLRDWQALLPPFESPEVQPKG